MSKEYKHKIKLFFFALEPLRFKLGDKVQANVGTFKSGTIIRLWDNGNPYRIELNDGTNVWGPVDDDQYVRRDVSGTN